MFSEQEQTELPHPLPIDILASDEDRPSASGTHEVVALNGELEDVIEAPYVHLTRRPGRFII